MRKRTECLRLEQVDRSAQIFMQELSHENAGDGDMEDCYRPATAVSKLWAHLLSYAKYCNLFLWTV